MEILFPDIGLFFWTVFAFGIFLLVMKKFAWKPLLSMLKEREEKIEKSLSLAEQARFELANLDKIQKKMMEEAQDERKKLLQETRADRQKMLEEAKEKAASEANRIIEVARAEINAEREKAFKELKAEILGYSVQIAEMILKEKIEQENTHQHLIDRYLKEMKLN